MERSWIPSSRDQARLGIFDALPYATGRRMGIGILALDEEFKKFIGERGYDHEIHMSYEEIEELGEAYMNVRGVRKPLAI